MRSTNNTICSSTIQPDRRNDRTRSNQPDAANQSPCQSMPVRVRPCQSVSVRVRPCPSIPVKGTPNSCRHGLRQRLKPPTSSWTAPARSSATALSNRPRHSPVQRIPQTPRHSYIVNRKFTWRPIATPAPAGDDDLDPNCQTIKHGCGRFAGKPAARCEKQKEMKICGYAVTRFSVNTEKNRRKAKNSHRNR